ncbi:MAG: peptidylprolyl isomerase [Acidimicrobiia bacterium]
MKRYLICAAVVAMFAAACGGGGNVAATVNGSDIQEATVRSLVSADQEMTDADFRGVLTAIVEWTAINDAASADFGIEPTDQEISDYSDGMVTDAGVSRDDYLTQNQVSEAGFLLYAEQLLIADKVLEIFRPQVATPTAEEAQQALADDPLSWTTVCASHLLVGTADEANAALARLDAGEDFATVATDVSIDTTSGANGGDLGCVSPSQWDPDFADAAMNAEIGAVTGPVETQFGFHLILVTSRTEDTTDEIISQLADQRLSDLVGGWYLTSVTDAAITVDPQFGTWQTDPAPQIVAPES